MAKNRKGRSVNGILLLDKAAGLTSNAALQQVKRLYSAQKAGHTGSLDPLATGMLPICFGEATKMSTFLLNADKRYQVTIKLGVTTATGDAEGEIIKQCAASHITLDQIQSVIPGFIGLQMQIPPMYSALKVDGQPLYKLARKGKTIARKPREITLFDIKIGGLKNEELMLEVHCSKGTYIRTLAEDIGEALQCGGHVSALRRLDVANFAAANMLAFSDLECLAKAGVEALDAPLLPMEAALYQLPIVNISDDMAYYLTQGQAVLVPKAPRKGYVQLLQGGHAFIGVGCVQEDGRIAPKRMLNL
ncbi:MAG: tRNA pseudouridine(55) synthase TruB [Gammaproteobacteria bacterium]|nr:tRNA pseudouridine(55) synthase TruB [Gammaproteobacteria bacterium]